MLLFGVYRELAGSEGIELDVPAGTTVGDLTRRLRTVPGLETLPQAPLVAVNHAYADAADPLSREDEVALIPPVAGG